MRANQRGKTKAGKVHQFTCGVRQRLVGGGGHDKYAAPEPVQIDRSSVTLQALAVRFAEIEARFAPRINQL